MRKISNPRTRSGRSSRRTRASTCRTRSASTPTTSRRTPRTACVYMEGWQTNKNRLDLAKLAARRGQEAQREVRAAAERVRPVLHAHAASLNQALQSFTAAVEADPKFVEARINVGPADARTSASTTRRRRVRQGARARAEELRRVRSASGIALRGLKDFDGAEAQYKKAKQLDPQPRRRLLQPRRALQGLPREQGNDPDPIKALRSQDMYRKAKDYFQQFARQGRRRGRQGRGEEQHRRLRQGRQAARLGDHQPPERPEDAGRRRRPPRRRRRRPAGAAPAGAAPARSRQEVSS